MAAGRVGLSHWFIGKGSHMHKRKIFPSAYRTDLCYGHSYKTQPRGGLGTRLWEGETPPSVAACSYVGCWVRWNVKSYWWPYKTMIKVVCELYGCWPVVDFLYVAEFCRLQQHSSRKCDKYHAYSQLHLHRWVQSDDSVWLILDILNVLKSRMPVVW